jgi:hypothetical protein
VLAVPALGQVEGEVAAAVPGGAGGHGDQVAADGRGPGPGEVQGRQGAGGAQQVVRHGRDRQPRGVRGEHPGWHMSKGSAGDVGEDLLHHGVVPVLLLGLDQLERGIGEHRVVAPDGKQLVLPGSCLLVQVADPADHQPRGDCLALLRRERRVLRLGDLRVGDPGAQLVVPDRARVPDRRPALFRDGGDRGADAGVQGTVTENRAPPRRTAPITAAL